MDILALPHPLDELLGGLERGTVTNIYGAPGTGKTNICMHAVIEAVRRGDSVVYIDTEGSFSTERLKQLAPDWENIAGKITIIEPSSFAEQGKIIRNLKPAGLIVLDSAVSLYRLEHAENDRKEDIMKANRELSKQIAVLSKLARGNGSVVLITAHMFQSWDTGEHDVVGGESLKYWSKALVLLERTGKMSERKATLIKHRWLPEGKSVKFMLSDDGIVPSTGFRLF